MRRETSSDVDTSSTEFNEGVEAGLNSPADSKNWKAGNELGQELKNAESKNPASENYSDEVSGPLFMSESRGGNQGNAQDEKDETEE